MFYNCLILYVNPDPILGYHEVGVWSSCDPPSEIEQYPVDHYHFILLKVTERINYE